MVDSVDDSVVVGMDANINGEMNGGADDIVSR